jgi:hypothetical protein
MTGAWLDESRQALTLFLERRAPASRPSQTAPASASTPWRLVSAVHVPATRPSIMNVAGKSRFRDVSRER